ncbi:MAG TPA: tetratricopeptide repeat protein, partial [Pyrinomonadaceae bacterium]|nr:tetratricopeptide repeat protein [Pyrinomonadaceae bacterium]
QLSRSVQRQLPEGVLGDMSQRVRAQMVTGQFGQGLFDGVDHFVSALAKKLSINIEDIDPQKQTAAATATVETTVTETPPVAKVESTPIAKVTASPDLPETITTVREEPTPSTVREEPTPTTAREEPSPSTVREDPTRSTRPRLVEVRPDVRPERRRDVRRPNTPEDDEDEAEEVELTLTLPLEERIAKLKALLESFPNSKAKPRAIELLISSYAALGDQRLQSGDVTGGIQQLMLAITEAPASTSDKLFSGVISQIPLNLYLRGHSAEAAEAAKVIEDKFGSDSKRLLALAAFYLRIEYGEAAARVARQAVKLAPDSAEAHHTLALALHISLRLDEAAAEYQRALDLDPNWKGTRRSLADLYRASGKTEEALSLYRAQVTAEPGDKAARAGILLSLLDMARSEEADKELAAILQDDPRNLAVLTGAAYWFAAHNNSERALELARKAVDVEPRYTWAQIALARALIAQKKPLEAERALRFARQYGKFPTLDYELANVLGSAGLYEEAAEVLRQSFSLKDGLIEARLAGRVVTQEPDFIKLLAPERLAGLFQSTAADTAGNAAMLKALLAFVTATTQASETENLDESAAAAAAKEFAAGPDEMRVYRQLYAANRLVGKGIALQTAYDLTEAARSSVDEALSVPAVTMAVQAEEYREMRASAIAQGNVPDIADAPRNVLGNILRGRIEDLAGWALFHQNKTNEAVDHLKRAVGILPEGTPASRTALWHLGAALAQAGEKEEALRYYIKSYNAGDPDAGRRAVIEHLYQKTYGSLDGLSEGIGGQLVAANIAPAASGEKPVPPTTEADKPVAQPAEPDKPVAPPVEATPSPEPSPSPAADAPSSSTEPSSAPTPSPSPEMPRTPSSSESLPGTILPTTVKITGKVRDADNAAVSSVVVVLISPRGTVLATTTDSAGKYSFVIPPSLQNYRIIPSKDGYSFTPMDKVLAGFTEDQKDIDFVATPTRSP